MYLIKDYLKFYKDTSFKEVSFNEIDNILFSELSYLNFKNIITNKKISMNEAINLYLNSNNKDNDTTFINGIIENIKIIKDSKRYSNCYLFNYVKEVSNNKQFGVLSIQIVIIFLLYLCKMQLIILTKQIPVNIKLFM